MLEIYKRKAYKSLYFFSKYVLGYKDMMPQPHWELCNFIERYADTDDCLILLPRGTFKTTVGTICWTTWKLWHDPELRFLITGAELGNSKKFLSVIKDHIEQNQVFRAICGEWDAKKATETWHSEAIHIAPRSGIGTAQDSITCGSVSTTKVSQHYDYAIIDDLVTDKNVATRDQIDKAEEYLNYLLPILDPRPGSEDPGPRILYGTRWSYNDVYARIIARDRVLTKMGKPSRYRKLIRRAIGKDKSIFFPTRFTLEYLNRLKIESGLTPYQFSCQYLNDPIAEGDQPFKLSHIKFYHQQELERKALSTFTAVDPAIGQSAGACNTAIVTVSLDVDGIWYIRECKLKKMLPAETISEIWKTIDKFSPQRVGIEAVSYQRALALAMKEAQLAKNRYVSILELKPDANKTKEMRLYGLEPYFQGNLLHFPADPLIATNQDKEVLLNSATDGCDLLLDEILHFPLGGTDDGIDALAYIPQMAYPARVRDVTEDRGMHTFNNLRKMLLKNREECY